METTKKCLILSVGKPYNFVPDGSTEAINGCKMYYVGADDIMKKATNEEDSTLGYFPQKITMPPVFYDKAKSVGLPAYADVTYNIKLTSKGAEAEIVGVIFSKEK